MDPEPKKLVYEPEELPPGSQVPFCHVDKTGWTPTVRHSCTFAPEHFETIMVNLVRNPNLNSKWLFRADILYDDGESAAGFEEAQAQAAPQTWRMQDFACERTMVRKLIPRNTMRDAPLDQTCFFYKSSNQETNQVRTLVVYRPHATAAAELPFYHPKVEAIAQLHEWDATASKGTISIHFLPFEHTEAADQAKLGRIAYHLLELIHKHGHTTAAGYTKRVNHDVVVPREKFQDRYSELKNKYARALVEGWAETTDPSKHVFEDLGIAAFLIELWAEMYRDSAFPGFVDIGCGNGLLVYILRQEGYSGWGFDARERKSWAQYRTTTPSGDSLQRLLLLPSVVPRQATCEGGDGPVSDKDIHDGVFPEGTFIISNHADELTPWTPILATISQCPFIMIPCCSHNLTGERYRAPPPRDRTKGQSAFASLVDWVTRIAEDCGWQVETEMLRIPSTRNTGLLGRSRTKPASEVDITAVMQKYGGVAGYYSNVLKLLKSAPRGH